MVSVTKATLAVSPGMDTNYFCFRSVNIRGHCVFINNNVIVIVKRGVRNRYSSLYIY